MFLMEGSYTRTYTFLINHFVTLGYVYGWWRGPHALSINYLTVAFDVVCDVVATLLPRVDRIEFLRGKGFACACPESCTL